MEQDKLLNTNETAHFLRVSPSTLRKWRVMGKGPRYIKVGSSVIYSIDDIIEFLKSRTVYNTSQYYSEMTTRRREVPSYETNHSPIHTNF